MRLLGPLSVTRDGEPLPPLRNRRALWLLSLLALRQSPTPREWLSATLWPDSEPAQAAYNLRRCLSELRAALGPHANRLQSPTMPMLRLDLANADIDVHRFQRQIKRGTPADLEAALECYGGDLLEGCDLDWIALERQRLREAYHAALEERAAQYAQTQEWDRAAALLRRLIAREPAREPAYCRLMEALAAQGARAEVTQAHRALRLYLHDELRTAPAPETDALYACLQSAPAAASRAADTPRPAPSARLSDPPASRLPSPVSALIGRAEEAEELIAAIKSHRLLTLKGPGGIGKTRLAIEAARRNEGNFSGGTWFVDLAPLRLPEQVLPAIAALLAVRETAETDLLTGVKEALRRRHALLLLDNGEHLAAACAEIAGALLPECPRLHLLVTSRQSLGAAGEILWPLAPLSLPPAFCPAFPAQKGAGDEGVNASGKNERRADLMESDAVRLFVERAQAVNSRFAPNLETLEAVAEICRLLEGVPFAIELAAAWMKVLNASALAVRLRNTFALLARTQRAGLPRQQTLWTMLDWSFRLLEPAEQTLLRRLSVFAGGWTLEAAEAVCGPENDVAPTALLLYELVDKSLVTREERNGETWYRLLATTQEYAAEKLPEAERDELRRRHTRYFAAYAEQIRPRICGPDAILHLDRLEMRQPNLYAAADWGRTDRECSTLTLRILTALYRLWGPQFNGDYIWHTAQEALARPETQSAVPERVRALIVLAARRDISRRSPDFIACAEAALALAQTWNDPILLAHAQTQCAASLILSDEPAHYERAHCLLREAEPILVGARDPVLLPALCNTFGLLEGCVGGPESARPHYERAIALYRETGNLIGLTAPLYNLCFGYRAEGNWDAARPLQAQLLALHRALRLWQNVTNTLLHLTMDCLRREEYRAAQEHDREWLETHRAHHLGLDWRSLEFTATIALHLGDFRRAAVLLGLVDRWAGAYDHMNGYAEFREMAEETERTTREQLGEEAFAAAFAQGRAMNEEEGLLYALELEGADP